VRVLIVCLILFSVPATSLGQAVVEHAVITGSTTVGTAAGTKGVGQSIGAVFGELNKKLGSASSSRAATVRVPATWHPSEGELFEAERIRDTRVDVEKIEEGLSASELVELFGKPQMMISSGDGGSVYHYTSTKQEPVEVLVKDGAVSSWDVKRVEVSKRLDVVIIR